jgi:hypothetical protein
MTDNEFRQQLSRKLDAFTRVIHASLKAEDDRTARYALIQDAYEALGQFLKQAMGPQDGDATDDQKQADTGKSDDEPGSTWDTIRPIQRTHLNVGSGATKNEDGSSWNTIQPIHNPNLTMDGETTKGDDQDASSWDSIRPRGNRSGLEVQ